MDSLTPLSKFQPVEVVESISSYSKVDLVDKKKASERKQFYNWNEDSYRKMSETPEIQGHILYESTTRANTPISLTEITPLWETTIAPKMAPVAFPSKPIAQLYPINGIMYQSVLRSRVPVQAQYRDAPEQLSSISSPLQPQSFYTATNRAILPDQPEHNPGHLSIDQLLNGMNQELVTYHKRRLLR